MSSSSPPRPRRLRGQRERGARPVERSPPAVPWAARSGGSRVETFAVQRGRVPMNLHALRADDPASRSEHAPAAANRPACRFCGAALTDRSSTWGCRRSARASSPRTSSTGWSRSIRCTCASASECFLVQLPEYVAPEAIFTRVRVLLVVLGLVGRSTPRDYVDAWSSSGSGSDADELRRRDRQQRRLPAPALRRSAASRCSGSSPPANVAAAARRAGRPDAGRRSSARRRRGELVARRAAADLIVGNNVLAQAPT